MRFALVLCFVLYFSLDAQAQCDKEILSYTTQKLGYQEQAFQNKSALLSCKKWPNNPSIIIVAIISGENATYFSSDDLDYITADDHELYDEPVLYQLHLALVDTRTWQIISQNKQMHASMENALFVTSLEIDSVHYALTDTRQAFGVKIGFSNQLEGYRQSILNIYEPQGRYITPLMQDFIINKYGTTINKSECKGSFVEINRSLKTVDSKGYYNIADIIVAQTVVAGNQFQERNKCITTTQSQVKRYYRVRFEKSYYQVPNHLDTQSANLYSWLNAFD